MHAQVDTLSSTFSRFAPFLSLFPFSSFSLSPPPLLSLSLTRFPLFLALPPLYALPPSAFIMRCPLKTKAGCPCKDTAHRDVDRTCTCALQGRQHWSLTLCPQHFAPVFSLCPLHFAPGLTLCPLTLFLLFLALPPSLCP